MRTLVTGGDGQLGRALRALFASEGEVEAPDLDRMDVTDRRAVYAFCERFRPDLVVHAAALTDVDGCEGDAERAFRVNGEGARIVAEEAARRSARLVFVSTDFVFDGAKGEAYTEEDEPNPISVYGESKLAGERATRVLVPDAVVARTAWLYGEGGPGNFVRSILKAAGEGKDLSVVDDQHGSPTYAADAAGALLSLVRRGAKGTFHVVNAGETNRFLFARRVLDLSGRGGVVVRPIPTSESGRPARRPARSTLRSVRLREAGVAPLRPWEEALAEYLARIGERKPSDV
ncbi:MAG: dTDP-4-dehydrorhamnose reductase [Candidatus Eisenbacteria bacterium]